MQNLLKKELFAIVPDIQFLGEENGLQEIKADSFWILDPVDGTINLMHDYQNSVVSLALCRQGEIDMARELLQWLSDRYRIFLLM